MNRLADRKKQRQEYLQQKVDAYTQSVACLLLCGLAIVAALWMSRKIPTLYHSYGVAAQREKQLDKLQDENLDQEIDYDFIGSNVYFVLCGGAGLAVLGFGWMSYRTGRRAVKTYQSVSTLPYVPPVIPSTLPAEEILVRGAEPPSAKSATLLRPAIDDAQTPAEQLLRATNGAGPE